MTQTTAGSDWCKPSELIKEHAAAKSIDYLTLVERILWRQWSTHRMALTQVMGGAADNILWDQAHEEALKRQHYTGDKYDSELSITDIAQRLRADIKEQLPDIKATVRSQRYAGGQSLDITVRKTPFRVRVATGQYTEEAERLEKRLRQLADAYNFDNGDFWTDYYHSNFFLGVDFLTLAKEQEEYA